MPRFKRGSAKAANGSATEVDAATSGIRAKGSRTVLEEFGLDEVLEDAKSPNALLDPSKSSNTFLLVVCAGGGAVKLPAVAGDGADEEPKASNSEVFCLFEAVVDETTAVISLNGSSDGAALPTLSLWLVDAEISKALSGEDTGEAEWFTMSGADAESSSPNRSSSVFCRGLRPIRSLVADGALASAAGKLDPGGGAILNEPNFGAGGRGVFAFVVTPCAVVLELEKSPKAAKSSFGVFKQAELLNVLKSPKDCTTGA